MERPGVSGVKVLEISNEELSEKQDLLAVEEPLEIRIGYGANSNRFQKSLVVTLRTPGNDFELAIGFLYSEGIIDSFSDVTAIKYCDDVGKQDEKGNVVRVELNPEKSPDFDRLERNFFMNASCGVCGKTSIDSVKISCKELAEGPKVEARIVCELIDKMEERQRLFDYTGGLHAAGLFSNKGEILLMREDIGRHNAVDKVIGAALIGQKFNLSNCLLLLSGRAGFELVQKAIRAGICITAAVGAPSSLSVSLAQDFGLTLVGFLKKGKFNIYSGSERILLN
jgi:FdhD protein